MIDTENPEWARKKILSAALEFANQDERKPFWLGGDTFKLPRTFEQLQFRFDLADMQGAYQTQIEQDAESRSMDEIMSLLRSIAKDAVRNAIQELDPSIFGIFIMEGIRSGTRPEEWVF